MASLSSAFARFSSALGRAASSTWRAVRSWLSAPAKLCLCAVALSLAASVAAWSISARFVDAVIYFPDGKGSIRGELRDIPKSYRPEDRAELVASELLLGPADRDLVAAFTPGAQVRSVLYRKGNLFLDLSPEAALPLRTGSDAQAGSDSVKAGLSALERTLRAALPGIKRITLAIGGYEPYAAGLSPEEGRD